MHINANQKMQKHHPHVCLHDMNRSRVRALVGRQRHVGDSAEGEEERKGEEPKTTRAILSATWLEMSSCVRPVTETCTAHTP